MTVRRTPSPFSKACPSRRFIELIGDKWSLLLLRALMPGPQRNGALMRKIEGISQKMLTQTLRRLEGNGLVSRADLQTVPPHVEYTLTELGESFSMVMDSLDRWIEQNLPKFVAAIQTDTDDIGTARPLRRNKVTAQPASRRA